MRDYFPKMFSEAALAHVLKDRTEAAYQRGDLLEKRRNMMNEWDSLSGPPKARTATVALP